MPKPVIAALDVATATALPVATGIGATATAGMAAMATADTATAVIGRDMESSAAKSAGARYGVQATYAVDGYIETPKALSRPSALNLPGKFGPLKPVPSAAGCDNQGVSFATLRLFSAERAEWLRKRGMVLSSIRSQILGVAIVMRPANLGTTTCAAVFATLLALIGQVAAQEATEETTGALPQETSTLPIEEGGAAVNQAAAGSGIFVTKRPVEVLAGPSSSASVLYGFPAGRPFRLIGRDAGFAKIQDLKSSATGWIDETALAQPSYNEATSAPDAATVSSKQDAGTLTPEQSLVQKPGRPKGRQGPLSGFLGGIFGTR